MKRRTILVLSLGLACRLPAMATGKQPTDRQVGDKLPAASAPARNGGFATIEWDALMPTGWDPMKDMPMSRLSRLNDGDPKAQSALDELKRAWAKSPIRPDLDGKPIRIAGFVVPLEGTAQSLTEFLLVPYFGACIHVPPPPSNQIIHIKSSKPLSGVRSMDAIWVSGTLHTAITDTAMGTSGYRLDLVSSAPYVEPGASRGWKLR